MNTPEPTKERRYACVVEEVHSGDDLIALVDLGHDSLFKRTRVRLQGVDTPDAYKEKVNSVAGSVREQVRRWIHTNDKRCIIERHAEVKGGWICTLFIRDEGEWVNLNERLIGMGYVYRKPEA